MVMAAADEASAAEAPKKKKLSGKKLVLFILLPVLLLGGGGAAAYFLLLKKDPAAEKHAAAAEENHAAEEPQVYVALEKPLQVNLVGTGKRMPYLNLDLWLAVKNEEDAKHLEGVMPRVIDQVQVYRRSPRIEDRQAAAAVQRMRDELLMRAKGAAKPI